MHDYASMVEMLREIQALEFAVYDLALFLDTHPCDKRALEDHTKLVHRLNQLRKVFEDRYGPLRLDSQSPYPYRYINDPWPWEIHY
ncbi:spore coat protein CotJB [Thermosediminibacter litoriperuensis]|uniref:Spore coat protein JB n=1 Tax=Thermosediminibacter litoriperuensis TaxID=291989 RepID=A0A5S5AW92_9FIRM|nr:spore coat protein CotJB [Thermosediminibacter litoriperuensis]TYP57628.1 spore coat protein JB [Thermosediminibacter litoriperuensis]